MLEHSHVRIPPDSTGKRMLHSMYMIIHYQFAQDAVPGFGETIIGSHSAAEATIVFVDNSNTMSNGFLGVMSEKFSDTPFTTMDSLLFGGLHVGNVVHCTPFYQPYMHLAGGNDTVNLVQIDNKGSMYTRYAEGEPQMDAFANLKVSDSTLLGEYAFPYQLENYRWQVVEDFGGSVVYQPLIKGMLLQNNTNVNALSQMTTHQYHKYTPGKGQTIQCTVACGDTGKANVIRRWGYFDDNDGIYYELNQNTIYACIRSSVSGSIVETKMPRSEWNRDRLTGLGGHYNYSRHALDVSKNTIYEFDFQWLGTGTVRFFVNVGGSRVPCHEMHNSGKYTVPYMRTGTLPFRVEQINTGTADSTSEMRFYSAAVVTDGEFKPFYMNFSMEASPGSEVTGGTNRPVASVRVCEYLNGTENRGQAFLKSAYLYSSTQPCAISMIMDGELVDPFWMKGNACPDSMIEIDGMATGITGGRMMYSTVIPAGEPVKIDLGHIFNPVSEFSLRRKYNITEHTTITMIARSLYGTATQFHATLNWEEVY